MAPILSRLAVEVNEKPLCRSLRSRHYLFPAGIYEVPLNEDSVLLLRALPTQYRLGEWEQLMPRCPEAWPRQLSPHKHLPSPTVTYEILHRLPEDLSHRP